MKTKTLLFIFLLVLGASQAFSQGVIMRVLTYNGPGNSIDEVTGMAMESNGSVYVTGFSTGTNSGEDFATIKFNNNGDFLWVSRFNGTGNVQDRSAAIVLDAYGNVYVTGWGYMEPTANPCGTIDFITIKYNTFGEQQWVKTYNGTGGGEDKAVAIALDLSGNVYVGGTSNGGTNKEDYVIVKYNNAGVQQWVARYDGVSHDADFLNAIGLDRFGNVFATGSSYKSGYGADYVTLKYNANTGALLYTARYNGPGNGDDKAYSIATDVNGNSFVTGSSKGSTSNLDYATVKYDASGSQLWAARYNGTGNNIDEGHAIIIDPYGNSYVTGFSMGTSTNYDYATLRYDQMGNQLWVQRYNSSTNGIDKAWDIDLTKRTCPGIGDYPCWNFDIYVTGQSQSSTGYDYLTTKYDENGVVKWSCRYTSSGNYEDVSKVLVMRDDLPYIFMGGRLNNDYGIVQVSTRYTGNDNNFSLNNQKPESFSLSQNYPNPFNPTTVITYQIPKDEFVEVTVYDLLGKQVSKLVNEFQTSGNYNISFDASNLPSGTYVYTIKAGSYVESKKMVLMK